MDIELKPIRIVIRPTKDGQLSVETPVATATLPRNALSFVTQGLAYHNDRSIEVDASPELTAEFGHAFDSQLCLSHLSRDISPFLANYLENKAAPRTNPLFTLESLLADLRGRRILFCGAGPSLYQHWDFIRRCLATGHAFVIAGGSAIQAFANEGIIPDLCLACDPNPLASTRAATLSSDFQASTLLLAGSGVNPEFLDHWSGPLVLTNGLSALPLGQYLEPGRVTLTEGGIGVSTFAMHLARTVDCPEFLQLGVDLRQTRGGKLYPDSLGFDNGLDSPREKIWKSEAMLIGSIAKEFNLKVLRPKRGRPVPHTQVVNFKKIKVTDGPTPLGDLIPEQSDSFLSRLHSFHHDLVHLPLDNVAASPLFEPFINIYHHIYLARMLITGEYAADSLKYRLNVVKHYVENLLAN
jgi:hypothetical protein